MSYNGEPIYSCNGKISIHPDHVYIVYVPGSPANPCGHVLLRFSGKVKGIFGNHYFHIPGGATGIYDHPYYLNEEGFKRYMASHQKNTDLIKDYPVIRFRAKLDNRLMEEKLCDLVKRPYLWGLIVHNCQSFVEEVIRSGGGQFFDLTKSECPKVDLAIHEKIKSLTNNGRKLESVQFLNYVFSF